MCDGPSSLCAPPPPPSLFFLLSFCMVSLGRGGHAWAQLSFAKRRFDEAVLSTLQEAAHHPKHAKTLALADNCLQVRMCEYSSCIISLHSLTRLGMPCVDETSGTCRNDRVGVGVACRCLGGFSKCFWARFYPWQPWT